MWQIQSNHKPEKRKFDTNQWKYENIDLKMNRTSNMMSWINAVIFMKSNILLGVTTILNLSCKRSKWYFWFSKPTHPWKCQMWLNIFLSWNILHRYYWKQSNCKKPAYYTMITLFGQNRILTIKITICQLVSPISIQAAPLNSMAEPSNFAPGSLIGMRNF